MFQQKISTFLIGSSILSAGAVFAVVMPAQAASLSTSASCSGGTSTTTGTATSICDVNTDYGYSIELDQDAADSSIFYWTLTNTSTQTNPEALIDQFWFNTNPDLVLGTDFTISNINPNDWVVTQSTGGARFDYTGDTTGQAVGRLGNGDTLTFTIDIEDGLGTTAEDFSSIFSTARQEAGKGIGGGNDEGQVAVSFQQLGAGGGGSDLLASNWQTFTAPPPPRRVPEPTSLFALGLIGGGMFLSSRKNG
ncbi:PEP-CTERM sorting domain-containing protein [Dapis sp. BLCC M126]|uniref:PEP-CTERM sorting domain-containing protein n=1 Tax=Dapis sp. BLCC M126 TaxID=3400189 RepID=UPI003CF28C65